MSRTKRTMLNALVSTLQLVINSVFSLLVNRLVISRLGSDYNGVNATVSQVLIILNLFEGGFTLASLVALYKPYTENDHAGVNAILTTTKNALNKVAAYTMAAGTVISFIFPLTMKSGLPYPVLVAVFLLSVVSLSFNFSCVLKYSLLFQAAQREYVVTGINLLGKTVLFQLLSILCLLYYPDILLLNIINALVTILSGLAVKMAAHRLYPRLDLKVKAEKGLIKGTRDVFVGNVTSFLYTSSTVLFISTFVSTATTSVYAVYSSVVSMVSSVVYAIIRAPQNALGQVIAEGNKEKTYHVFEMLEYITILFVCFMLSVAYALIVPFVTVYTRNIHDANYINHGLALLLILTGGFELIHIPSGLCINLHGDFRAARNIQMAAAIIMLSFSVVGALLWNLYGIIAAKMLTAIYLAIAEIYYARRKLLKKNPLSVMRVLLPNVLLSTALAVILNRFSSVFVTSFLRFLLCGVINSVAVAVCLYALNRLMFPDLVQRIQIRARGMIYRKKRSTTGR